MGRKAQLSTRWLWPSKSPSPLPESQLRQTSVEGRKRGGREEGRTKVAREAKQAEERNPWQQV